MKKRILVTGGAGYIGSFVVNMLLDRGYNVVVLDKLLYGRKGLDSFLGRENLEFINGDVTDRGTVEDAIKGANCVIGLAAIVGDQACAVNEAVTWDINFRSVTMLVDLAIEQKVSRFVFTSSCSVYGCNGDKRFLTENSELLPVSLYARTRILSEKYIREKSEELSSVILRLSTVFGLSSRMRFDLAVNTMTGRAVRTGSLSVEGGSQWRPFVHVRDVARAVVLAVEADEQHARGETFNVGSTDSNYQISDIARLIAEEVPEVTIKEYPDSKDLRNYNCIFDKIHKKLNFKPETSVRDGITELVRFIKATEPDINAQEYSNFETWKVIGNSEKFIPYSVPEVPHAVRMELVNTIESGWLSTGPRTRLFEEKIQEYFGDPALHVFAVSSCTAALHLQLMAAGIGRGDEVITTPFTFCATVNSILYTGATPVLVDIDPSTFNIDIKLIEAKITSRTRAIVPVYYGGQAVDHKALRALADRHRLLILADAAHAIGARYDGRLCGTYEDSAAFSFYATKNMPIGEGGLVTTHNGEMAERIRYLMLHGMNRDAWKRYSESGSWYYEIVDLGYKYNFTDIQASFGLHQLARIDRYNTVRREYGEIYDKAFASLPGISLHGLDPRAYYTRHIYPVLIDEEVAGISRNRFIEELREHKIGTSVHYIPIHHHPFYKRNIRFSKGEFPVTDSVFRGIVSLPLYSKMTASEIARVASTVGKLVESKVTVH